MTIPSHHLSLCCVAMLLFCGCPSSDNPGEIGGTSASPTNATEAWLGTWTLDSHMLHEDDCSAAGQAQTRWSHVGVHEMEGQQVGLKVFLCDAADVCDGASSESCPSGFFLKDSHHCTGWGDLSQQVEDGWSQELIASSGTSADCSAGFNQWSLTRNGDGIRLERESRNGLLNLDGAACSAGNIPSRADALPCKEREVLLAH